MLRHTKRTLHSIRNLTELAWTKFSGKELGDFFYRSVIKDIGETDLLLEGFLQYLLISNPLKKKGTVNRLIEEVSKKYQVQLEAKRIKLSRKYEEDLPETIIPDEPLRYILNSILQYGVNSVTPDGDMEFLTQSFIFQREAGARHGALRKDERHIEISLVFTGYKKWGEPSQESPVIQEEEPLSLMLRLVKEVVQKNQGIMRFETDEKKGITFISLRFPSERREIVHYQPIDRFMN